jgi:hypothetical protein
MPVQHCERKAGWNSVLRVLQLLKGIGAQSGGARGSKHKLPGLRKASGRGMRPPAIAERPPGMGHRIGRGREALPRRWRATAPAPHRKPSVMRVRLRRGRHGCAHTTRPQAERRAETLLAAISSTDLPLSWKRSYTCPWAAALKARAGRAALAREALRHDLSLRTGELCGLEVVPVRARSLGCIHAKRWALRVGSGKVGARLPYVCGDAVVKTVVRDEVHQPATGTRSVGLRRPHRTPVARWSVCHGPHGTLCAT